MQRNCAYWIGFIVADGYVSPSDQVFVKLMAADRTHLELLRRDFALLSRIKIMDAPRAGRVHTAARLIFSSASMATIVRQCRLGRIPKYLAHSREFWRGIVDGDGHLGVTNNKPRFTLVGRWSIMNEFLRFIKKRVPSLEAGVTKHGTIYAVKSASRPAQAVIRLLYQDASICLERKMILANKIMLLLLPDRTMKPRRRRIDETVFNRTTDESAYWIGYLFYNSYIGRRIEGQTPIEVHVGLKKQHYLEGLRDFLKSDYSVQITNASAKLSFRSDAIASALARHGIVPGRQNRQISAELRTDANFWRGVADGQNKRLRKNMIKS